MILVRIFLFVIVVPWLVSPALGQSGQAVRTWVDQTGRMVKGKLLNVEGPNVVLQLENNTNATVPVSRFSTADQEFVKAWAKAANKPDPSLAALPLAWPESVTVDAKKLQITTVSEDAAARQFVYQSGSFQFTSNAQLTPAVMRDIAGDFELVRTLFDKLPWGWQPKPQNEGAQFLAVLTETEADYIAVGGMDNSTGFNKGGVIYYKFSSLGLKKVGGRYARDTKLDREGEMIGLIARAVMGDMRSLSMPWSALGFEEFLSEVGYRNSSFQLAKPERGLKELIAERSPTVPIDLEVMMKLLRETWAQNRGNDVLEVRRQNYFFGALLVYYFGYLEGDGTGARLHRYHQAMAQDALAYRAYQVGRKSGKNIPHPRPNTSFENWAVDLNNKYFLDGRTDEQLRADIVAKYRSIGIKL